MDIESKILEINEAHKNSGLYDDSFDNVIYKFTNAYDYLYLEMLRRVIKSAREGRRFLSDDYDFEDLNTYRHAYRASIKFTYEDCDRGKFDRKITFDDISNYQKELADTINYNYIRNTIDRYKLGKYTASFIGDKLCFEHIKGDRSLAYDAYSRHIADELPGGKNYKDTIDGVDYNMIIIQRTLAKQEFESKKLFKPAKHVIRETINELINYYLRDFHKEIGVLQPSSYFLGEYLMVFCYLAAIGIYKTAYLLSLKTASDVIYEPSVIYPKERLISDIADVTEINKEVVRNILKDMTYDYEFHKNKVNIYQMLFEVGDNILYSTNMIFGSYIVDKAMKFYDLKGTNKQDITLYHKYMANKMNHRMADRLAASYHHFDIYENKSLIKNKAAQAEVDLVVFDHNSKTAALIELKSYTPIDGEFDAFRKDNHINDAIESRLEKDKRVLDNLELFFEQNNIPKAFLNYDFSSLIVTSDYAGGVDVKEKINVLDENLFYYLLSVCKGNLKDFIDFVNKGEFFKLIEQNIHFGDADIDYTYKGITVEIINKS